MREDVRSKSNIKNCKRRNRPCFVGTINRLAAMITTIIPCVGVSGNSACMFTLALPTFSANVPHIYAAFTACIFSLSFPAFSANVSHIYAIFTAMPSFHFWLLPSMVEAKNWLHTRGIEGLGVGLMWRFLTSSHQFPGKGQPPPPIQN